MKPLYHDDVSVDVVGARLVGVPVVQNHPSVVDWKDTDKQRLARRGSAWLGVGRLPEGDCEKTAFSQGRMFLYLFLFLFSGLWPSLRL